MLRAGLWLVAVLVLVGGGIMGARWAYDLPGPSGERRDVLVPRASMEQVAELLKSEGLVANAAALRLAELATRWQGGSRAGELSFPPRASLREVLAVLRYGKPVQHRLTIPEGLTAAQVALLLEKAPAMEGAVPIPPEGGIMPETYLYELNTDRSVLLDRAAKAMDRALERAWAARTAAAAPLATGREALILASIVERETGRPEERPRIAAVFLNRLRRGMKLQSDPTVVYGASGGLGTLDHGLTRAELDRDDPYNTYRIAALPPGPICMPSAAALKAVTQPWPGDELFFVADGSGGHVFARTEAEHNRNVVRWRDIERQRAARSQVQN